jgi:hypothetical protein
MDKKTVNEEKKSLLKRIRAKKDIILRVSMVLFVLAYPLSYFGAASNSTPFMGLALFVTGLGSVLAAML